MEHDTSWRKAVFRSSHIPVGSSRTILNAKFMNECSLILAVGTNTIHVFKNGKSVVRRCHRFYGNGLPLTFFCF